MTTYIDYTGRGIPPRTLLVRGVLASLTIGIILLLLAAQYHGLFKAETRLGVAMSDIGDGLFDGADVKYRGMVVGRVDTVNIDPDTRRSYVDMRFDPEIAGRIPNTVLARVVPSTIFGVSSVELVGATAEGTNSTGLDDRGEILQDDSAQALQLQTAMNSMQAILAAVEPAKLSSTLATISTSLSGRGTAIGTMTEQLSRFLSATRAEVPDAQADLDNLETALHGLGTAAPDVLSMIDNAIVPARTIAENNDQLAGLLTSAIGTFSGLNSAFSQANIDGGISLVRDLSIAMGALAASGDQIRPAVVAMNSGLDSLTKAFYGPNNKILFSINLSFTPFSPYTRADCPRYGEMAGPSCTTAPLSTDSGLLPASLVPRQLPGPDGELPESRPKAGNIGAAGSAEEHAVLDEILGFPTDATAGVLLGPLLRGNEVGIPDKVQDGER